VLPLEVFLNQNPDGSPQRPLDWGLRCTHDLHAGAYVGLYLGLVARWSQRDRDGGGYQLSLDHYYNATQEVHTESTFFAEVRLRALLCVGRYQAVACQHLCVRIVSAC
jgi:hypothetical protein